MVEVPGENNTTGRVITITKLETIVTLQQAAGTPKFWQNEERVEKEEVPLVNPAVPPSSSLIRDFQLMYEKSSQDLSDVTVVVENKTFFAHKAVLAARSTYFMVLFTNKMQEIGQTGILEIHVDCDAATFSSILKWIYTDKIEISSDSVVDRIEQSRGWKLWSYSNFFCLPKLTSIVEQHLINVINSTNVCYFWNHVHKLDATNLQQACKKYFTSNLHSIVNTPGLLALERAILLDVFYAKQHADTSGLSTNFSQQSLPHRTAALACWFATHQPEKLKRKLAEQRAFVPAKRSCTLPRVRALPPALLADEPQ